MQDHFEQLETHWQDCYAQRYGFWRPFVTDVIYRYLECVDLHSGFAWVRCQDWWSRVSSGDDFQQFNPHLHLIATDGCFSGSGTFAKSPELEPKYLIKLFRYEVLKMLKAEDKIKDAVIEIMLSWRHNGFNVDKVYQSYRKKKIYYHTVGNGIHLMASSHRFGIFYSPVGATFHLLYLFDENLEHLNKAGRQACA